MPIRMIGAVVVTHESHDVLARCILSLEQHHDGPLVVVDDASPTDLPIVSPDVQVIRLASNGGYGGACNIGASDQCTAGAEMLAFLNPDVRLRGSSLRQLADQVDADPRIGIATGPVVDPQGRRQASAWGETSVLRAFWFATGWRVPGWVHHLGRVTGRGALTSSASRVQQTVDVRGHVLGGAMLVRRECWEDLGGFDEDFFLFWEDADLCTRARQRGWKVAVLPCTPIVHDSGTSSAGVTETQRWQWYVDGARIFAGKHLGRVRRRLLLAALHLGRWLGRRH